MKHIRWSCDPLPAPADRGTLIPLGLGNSLGDCCLNNGGTVVVTRGMNRLLDFDAETGLIRCEAGATLDEVLRFAVPRGWFLPTTPGTSFITVGGAVANDVHGKNHHWAGSFGCHVTRLELLRSDGRRLVCSLAENSDFFAATIGGMGLTGLITWVEFRLRRIVSTMIETESVKFRDLDEFFDVSEGTDARCEHTVAWVDCVTRGRGILMCGNNVDDAGAAGATLKPHTEPRLNFPHGFPSCALNRFSIRLFNQLYYSRQLRKRVRGLQHYSQFFYPLDVVKNWHRVYGAPGFFEAQIVLPPDVAKEALREIFKQAARFGQGAFLVVLKKLGSIRSPGLMSFPRPGVTLGIDFPNKGERTKKLFTEIFRIGLDTGAAFNPGKDALMPPECFAKTCPNLESFSAFIDPAFSSNAWRRLTKGLL
ncbi:FAD-binding oxidoreductase [Termitidicoccus mucosus]|uniref:FAD-binding oxidoreductase n=1 Tax=Termitidicoccus mucosus TaxID=1184151 RepID=UPI002FEE540A